MRAYRDYLKTDYLPKARVTLSLLANPDGAACYQAYLRFYTSTKLTAQEIFDLGQRMVEKNISTIRRLGNKSFGVDDFQEVIAMVQKDQSDRMLRPEEILRFARQTLRRSLVVMPNWFGDVPNIQAVVEPIDESIDSPSMSDHYEGPSGPADKGTYRISLKKTNGNRKSELVITVLHELYPGHHLQRIFAMKHANPHPANQLLLNSGFGEGWARYAESLAEEMGLYDSVITKILRRAWPARGMVVDPGIHLKHWTRDQAVAFVKESGRFSEDEASHLVDRIVTLPGQLTSYDTGASEFISLRSLAKNKLADRFDIREFHKLLLSDGAVPLWMLREKVTRWIRTQELESKTALGESRINTRL